MKEEKTKEDRKTEELKKAYFRYHAFDPWGCYVDPCSCYGDPCAWYAGDCSCISSSSC